MTQDYNTRRNELAEEMAGYEHDQLFKLGKYDSSWAEWSAWMKDHKYQILVDKEIAKFLPLADISLKHQAEEAKDGYIQGYIDRMDKKDSQQSNYLLTTGLIPDKISEK